MLPDDPGDHLFTPRLEADEPLLWVGRPDESVFMRQQRAGLQAQAKPGSPLLQTSGSVTLRVKQDSTVLRDLGTSAMRVSTRDKCLH